MPNPVDLAENRLAPLHVFNFHVRFKRDTLLGPPPPDAPELTLCSGAFAECTGLEATIEPKLIKVGGANTVVIGFTSGAAVLTWGLARALPVKFKAADLNARGSEVGIEELHLAHEGLSLLDPAL